jgi:prepilin-type N-terminal cleavage/methylation domain-containing protein
MRCRKDPRRSGLSLLEVLAALAIFSISAVIIGYMVERGVSASRRAQRLTRAAILCESRLAEIRSNVPQAEWLMDPEWDVQWQANPYRPDNLSGADLSVMLSESESVQDGLLLIEVSARWVGMGDPVHYSISRVILDPRLRPGATGQSSLMSTPSP